MWAEIVLMQVRCQPTPQFVGDHGGVEPVNCGSRILGMLDGEVEQPGIVARFDRDEPVQVAVLDHTDIVGRSTVGLI